MKAEHNELITRIGPGTACGDLLRHYWQPVALVDEFNPALDPAMAVRPVKAVRLLGQDFVLFKNAAGQFGLLDRDCPHRGADLAFGRNEGDGLRCPFHGWKFDVSGQCTETPRRTCGQHAVPTHPAAQLSARREKRGAVWLVRSTGHATSTVSGV